MNNSSITDCESQIKSPCFCLLAGSETYPDGDLGHDRSKPRFFKGNPVFSKLEILKYDN